eukprot:TRINITY_DN3933_c0_g4_i1.p4 TRINITY_DN3933_c0_g4~~TRINITY_DN3933_c0_g4_i1.p4  ORF type:complete len:131 (+),score=17.07 TRINITY_DN3933_c0_g4_i1:581-973(+)
MGIADHQPDTMQASTRQILQEVPPQKVTFAYPGLHFEDLAVAVHAYSHCNQYCQARHPVLPANLPVAGIHENIGKIAFQRTGLERRNLGLGSVSGCGIRRQEASGLARDRRSFHRILQPTQAHRKNERHA